jgi:hypothetical protein
MYVKWNGLDVRWRQLEYKSFEVDSSGFLELNGSSLGVTAAQLNSLTYNDPIGDDVVQFRGTNSFELSAVVNLVIGNTGPVREVRIEQDLVLSTNGSFSAVATELIDFDFSTTSKSSLIAVAGDISLSATGTGNGVGEGVTTRNGAVRIASQSGDISIIGIGRGAGGSLEGVQLGIDNSTGSEVFSQSGTISITGTGAGTLDDNRGVYIESDAAVRTVDGEIIIVGTGGGGSGEGEENDGVDVAGAIEATGDGSVSVTGFGGGTTSGKHQNRGIDVNGFVSGISTNSGSLTLDGTGGGSVGEDYNLNDGIRFNRGAVIESTSGTISITGRGGAGEDNNRGIHMTSSSDIVTETGRIELHGTGGGNHMDNDGSIGVDMGGDIVSTGNDANDIVIVGIAAGGSGGDDNNRGVDINHRTATIESVDANIFITGTGFGPSSDNSLANDGVRIIGSTARVFSELGSITVVGNGGDGEDFNYGISLNDGAQIESQDGDVTVRGTGGGNFAQANANVGVYVNDASLLIGSGLLTVAGTGGGHSSNGSDDNDGVKLIGTGAEFRSTSGNIAINAVGGAGHHENLGLNVETDAKIVSESGRVSVEAVGGGGFDDSDGNTGIIIDGSIETTAAESGEISLRGNGAVGANRDDNNRGIEIRGLVTTAGGDINIVATGGGGGSVDSDSNLGLRIGSLGSGTVRSSGGAIQITATGGDGRDRNQGVVIEEGGVIEVGASLVIDATGSGNGSDNYGVEISEGNGQVGRIVGTAGDVSITGRASVDGIGGATRGVTLISGATAIETTTGDVVVVGVGGGASGSHNQGIYIAEGTSVETVTGAISFNGTGGSSENDGNDGVEIAGVVATDAGDILITGVGTGSGFDADNNIGVQIVNQVTSSSGSVTLHGTGGGIGGDAFNDGVRFETVGTSVSAGGGISVTGIGGAARAGNVGIRIPAVSTLVSSGPILLNGTGGAGTGAENISNIGVLISGTITATSNASVTLRGTGGSAENLNVGVEIDGAEISAVAGDIVIDGTGGGSGVSNEGTRIKGAANVGSTNGRLTLRGTGSESATTLNHGVNILDADVSLAAGNGVVIQGFGRGTGDENVGVFLGASGFELRSPGIEIDGSSLAQGDGNAGVVVFSGVLLAGETGNVSVTGSGSDVNSNDNTGVRFRGSIATTSGNITVNGTGGDGVANNYGVDLSNSSVSTEDGAIQLIGSGGMGSATANHGVLLDATTISASAAGTISVEGTGGTGSDHNRGVEIQTVETTITTASGYISILGTAQGDGTNHDGVRLRNATIIAGVGELSIHGIAAGTGIGVELTTEVKVNTANGGNVSLTGTGAGGEMGVRVDTQLNSTGALSIAAVDGISVDHRGKIVTNGNVTLVSTHGPENAGWINMVDHADGSLSSISDISLTADGDITLGQLRAYGVGHDVRVTSNTGGIIDGGELAGDDIVGSGNRVFLSAATGIGFNDPLEISGTELSTDTSATGADQRFVADGVVQLGRIDAGTGKVVLSATEIIDAETSDSINVDLIASRVFLSAESITKLETSVDNFEAMATSGSLSIKDSASVTVGGAHSESAGVSATGQIRIEAAAIIVNEIISSTASCCLP